MADLVRLAKLIALATPPTTGPDGEAKAAAMAACAIIRDEKLSIWDKSAHGNTVPIVGELIDVRARAAAAAAENPVRVAAKKRHEDRIRREESRRHAASTIVGGASQ